MVSEREIKNLVEALHWYRTAVLHFKQGTLLDETLLEFVREATSEDGLDFCSWVEFFEKQAPFMRDCQLKAERLLKGFPENQYRE